MHRGLASRLLEALRLGAAAAARPPAAAATAAAAPGARQFTSLLPLAAPQPPPALLPGAAAALLRLRGYAASAGAGAAGAAAAPAPPRAGTPPPPWTPTEALGKRKALPKRMRGLVQALEAEAVAASAAARPAPDFRAGDELELRLAVPENKRRPATLRGLCIARSNRGPRSTFTLRNHVGGAGALERTFPLHSPHVLDIRVLGRRRVRRAKLFYLRGRTPKEYRVA